MRAVAREDAAPRPRRNGPPARRRRGAGFVGGVRRARHPTARRNAEASSKPTPCSVRAAAGAAGRRRRERRARAGEQTACVGRRVAPASPRRPRGRTPRRDSSMATRARWRRHVAVGALRRERRRPRRRSRGDGGGGAPRCHVGAPSRCARRRLAAAASGERGAATGVGVGILAVRPRHRRGGACRRVGPAAARAPPTAARRAPTAAASARSRAGSRVEDSVTGREVRSSSGGSARRRVRGTVGARARGGAGGRRREPRARRPSTRQRRWRRFRCAARDGADAVPARGAARRDGDERPAPR